MAGAIRLVLENFTLSFFVLGLVAALGELSGKGRLGNRRWRIEALLRWFLLFSIAASFLYNFVLHVFFGEMTASFIGWADSPFQAEVGYASLGFAAVGFLAWRGSDGLRLAAIVGPALFLWGAAIGHVQQMLTAGNFAPGNAGAIFWTDILLPIVGFSLLVLQHNVGRPERAAA